MRLISVSLCLIVSAAGAWADEVADIQDRYAAWNAAFNAGEADGICDLYAPDLRSVDRGQPDRGFDEVCLLLRDSLSDPTYEYRYQIDVKNVWVQADTAVVNATWTLFISPFNVTVIEEGLDVLRHDPDGVWRIVRSMSFEAP